MTGKTAQMSNYPSGFQSGLSVRDVNLALGHNGKVFYVADGDTAGNTPTYPNRKGASDTGNKGTFLAPFKTLDYAIGQCTADRGDTIVVLPGYVETLAAAATIDVDVDGITILGQGMGDKQPLMQFDANDATFEVNADNVTIKGLNFAASVTVVAKGVDVKDGSDDLLISDCRWTTDDPGTAEFEDALFIITSDRVVIERNSFIMGAGADADSAIHFNGACNGCVVRGNYVEGDYTIACIEGEGTLSQMIVIEYNTLMNGVTGGLNTVACIVLLTNTTGIFHDNRLYTDVSAPVTAAVAANKLLNGGGNFVSNAAELQPLLIDQGTNNIMRSETCISKADGTNGLGLFTVLGTIDVWGIKQTATTAASSASTIGVQINATDPTLDAVWVTETDLAAETTIGDFAVALTAGGGFTTRLVETPTENSWLWDTPIRCPAGTIEQLESGGTPGNLVSSYTIFWSEVSVGATCVKV